MTGLIVKVFKQYLDETEFLPNETNPEYGYDDPMGRDFSVDRFYFSIDDVNKTWTDTKHFL